MTQTTEHSTMALISASLALKAEIADCYTALAEQLENCNNSAAAALFTQLTEQQQQHLQRLEKLLPASIRQQDLPQTTLEQISPADDINADSHYLMTPYHVVELALNIEQLTQQNLQTRLGIDTTDQPSQPQQQEHARHIQFLQQLLSRQPQPESHWDEDLDPPNIDD